MLTFAGDGLLIQFTSGKAHICAKEMMKFVRDFKISATGTGKISLEMKAVLLEGSWYDSIVGDSSRAFRFTFGDGIPLLAQAEDNASAGDIIVIKHEELKKISDKRKDRQEYILKKAFIPRDTYRIIDSTAAGDHRPVSCMFLKFEDLDPGISGLDIVESKINALQQIVEKHKGSMQLIDNITLHGFKILCLFGAPLSYGDDTKNAVSAGMEIIHYLDADAEVRKYRIAINEGYVFSGIIGNKWRRTFTVMGDVVNTAARLCATSPYGRLVISDAVRRIGSSWLDLESLDGVKVKGKKSALKRYSVNGIKSDYVYSTEYIGRNEELELLREFLVSSEITKIVEGAAGIGKTRFITESMKKLKGEGLNVLRGINDRLKPPYFMFSTMIRNYAGILHADDEAELRIKFEGHIRQIASKNDDEHSKELIRRLPVLGIVLFGLDYPESIYHRLTPQLKKENVLDGIRYYLLCLPRPLCICFENVHLASRDDIDALNNLMKIMRLSGSTDINFLLVRRSEADIAADEGFADNALVISGLSPTESKLLIFDLLGDMTLESDVENIILERSEGNPFYIEQYISYLIDRELIEEDSGNWKKTANFRDELLPENVFSMIISRVDILENNIKEVLRVASVIGRNFQQKILEKVLRSAVHTHLQKSENENLIAALNEKEMEYIFSNRIIRDVIYDSILRKNRREFHLTIGNILEEEKAKGKFALDTLAYHFAQAEEWPKAAKYLKLAGSEAWDMYRTETAEEYLNRSIDIILQDVPDMRSQLSDIYDKLGIVLRFKGDYKESATTYEKMLEYSQTTEDAVKAMISLADVTEIFGDYKRTLSILKDAEKRLDAELQDDIMLRSKLYAIRCSLKRIRGDSAAAIAEGKKSLIIEKLLQTGDEHVKRLAIKSFNNLGLAYWNSGELDTALKYFYKCVDISKDIDDKFLISTIYSNMGIIFQYKNDPDTAKEYYMRSLEVSLEIGHKRSISISYGNIGTLYYDEEKYAEAFEYFQKDIKLASEIGDRRGLGIAYGNLANIYDARGEYEEAIEYYLKYLSISEEVDFKMGISISAGNIGETYVKLGEIEKGKEHFQRSLEVSIEIGDHEGELIALENLGEIYLNCGALKTAAEYLNGAYEKCSDSGDSKSGFRILLNQLMLHFQTRENNMITDVKKKLSELLKDKEISKKLWKYHFTLGKGQFFQNEFEKSLESLQLSLKNVPSDIGKEEKGDLLFNLGKCILKGGFKTPENGKKHLRDAINIFRQNKLAVKAGKAEALLKNM
ncbi:tetratricopeptide repeat protein [bacterium]|nr:tetratricopeptide repeat protein [bacterium]